MKLKKVLIENFPIFFNRVPSVQQQQQHRTLHPVVSNNVQLNGDSPDKKNKIKKNVLESVTYVDSPSAEQFFKSKMDLTENKSFKRIKTVGEGIERDSVIDISGIVHPETNELLTVGEAISLRILDVRTGMFNAIVNNKITPISIESAVKYGLIDGKLAEKLLGPCGVFENDREISLLEAIQQNISDAESGSSLEYLMKVRGTPVEIDKKDPILYQKFYFSKFGNNSPNYMTIQNAIEKNKLNPKTGLMTLENGEKIPVLDAFKSGILSSQFSRGKEKGLSLMDALEHGLIDGKGLIYDRQNGGKLYLDEGIKKGLINPNFREIVDSGKDNKITVKEAINNKIINPKNGNYYHVASAELLPFHEAHRRRLIIKPMTLKEAVETGVYLEGDHLLSPTHNDKINLLESIGRGVLDENRIKCVTDVKNDELITLGEAIGSGIILVDGKYVDNSTGEIMTIPEAVRKGLITSVTIRSIFDIDAFENNNEFVGLNTALDRKIITLRGDEIYFKHDNNFVTLEEGRAKGIIRAEVLEMLNKNIGIKDENGKELTVIEAVLKGYIDPKRGMIANPKTQKLIPTNNAIAKGIITEEGAALFNSLLVVSLTTQTITKTIITSAGKLQHVGSVNFESSDRGSNVSPAKMEFQVTPKKYAHEELKRFPVEVHHPSKRLKSSPDSTDFIVSEKINLRKEYVDDQPADVTVHSSIHITKGPEKKRVKKLIETISSETIQKTETITEKIIETHYSSSERKIKSKSQPDVLKLETLNVEMLEPPERPVRTKNSIKKPETDEVVMKIHPEQITVPTGKHEDQSPKTPEKKENFHSVSTVVITEGTPPRSALKLDPQSQFQSISSYTIKESVSPIKEDVSPERPARKKSKSPPVPKSVPKSEKSKSKKPEILDTFKKDDPKNETRDTTDMESLQGIPEKKVPERKDVTTTNKIVIDNSDQIKEPGRSKDDKSPESPEKTIKAFITGKNDVADKTEPEVKVPVITPTKPTNESPSSKTVKSVNLKIDSFEKSTNVKELPSKSDDVDVPKEFKEKPMQVIKDDKDASNYFIAHEKEMMKPEVRKFDLSRDEKISPNVVDDGGRIPSQLVPDEKFMTAIQNEILELPEEGWYLSEVINEKIFDSESGLFIIPKTDRLVSFEECIKLGIINPESVLVVNNVNSTLIPVDRALEKQIIDSTGHYYFDREGKEEKAGASAAVITMKEAIERELIIPKERDYEIEKNTRKKFTITKYFDYPSLESYQSFSDATENESLKKKMNEVVLSDEEIENVISATGLLNDQIDTDLIKVKDPRFKDAISFKEAVDRGIIDKTTGTYKDVHGKLIPLRETVKTGVIVLLGATAMSPTKIIKSIRATFISEPKTGKDSSVEEEEETLRKESMISRDEPKSLEVEENKRFESKDQKPDERVRDKTEIIPLEKSTVNKPDDDVKTEENDDDIEESLGKKTRERVTTEPKYRVAIGRAHSLSPSLEQRAKPVVLQKMRKKIIKPKEGLEHGIIDEKTMKMLENKDPHDTVLEALKKQKLDGDRGSIRDPQIGDIITIKEAVERNIINPEVKEIELLIPVARSLSIPEVLKQGLINEEGTIIHPETGDDLSLGEAIVCEIVNPLCNLLDDTGKKITLKDAISKGKVDENKSVLKTKDGDMDLMTASKKNIFLNDEREEIMGIPKIGMTLPVLVQRGLIQPDGYIVHPVTQDKISIKDAIDKDFIMSYSPHPVMPKSIPLMDALKENLVNTEKKTFLNKETGKEIPIEDAITSGLLVVKPEPSETIVEVIKSYQTIRRKTMELKPGYILISPNEIKNVKTGEIMSLKEASKNGIAYEISETEETIQNLSDPKKEEVNKSSPVEENLNKEKDNSGIVPDDVRVDETTKPESPVKTVQKTPLNLLEALEYIYDEKTGRFKHPQKEGETIDLKEAIAYKIIDPTALIVIDGQEMTTETAIKSNLIDLKSGTIKNSSGKKINIRKACKTGLLDSVKTPSGDKPTSGVKQDKVKDSKGKNQKGKSPDKIPLEKSKENLNGKKPVKDSKDSKEILPRKMDIIEPDVKKTIKVVLSSKLSPKDLHKMGIYDPDKKEFVDPETRELVPFNKWAQSFLNLNDVTVKNPSDLNKCVTLKDALNLGFIDPVKGTLKNPENDETISFFEGLQLGLIMEKLPTETFLKFGVLDPETGKIKDLRTGKMINVFLAVKSGLLDEDNVNVMNPANHEIIPLSKAIQLGIVDLEKEFVINLNTNERIDLTEAFKTGLLIIGYRKPISLKAVIMKKLYDDETGKIIDDITRKEFHLREAVSRGLIDSFISECKNDETDEWLTLEEAMKENLVDGKTGKMKMSSGKSNVGLGEALKKNLIRTKPLKLSLIDGIRENYYSPENGTFLCPDTGTEVTLKKAIIDLKFIDDGGVEIKDVDKNSIVSVREAMERGLLDGEKGMLTSPRMNLKEALEKGYLITMEKPLPLSELLTRENYDPKTGKFTIGGNVDVPLEKVNVDEVQVVKDRNSGDFIALSEEIKTGIVDPKSGIVQDPVTREKIHLLDALNHGIIIPTKPKYSLSEIVFKGLYNPKTGKFVDPDTKEELSIDSAIEKGTIDPVNTLVKDADGNMITFEEAVKKGIVDVKKGIICKLGSKNLELDFQEAFDRGLFVEIRLPMTLTESIIKNVLNKESGKFLNPNTGKSVSLKEAIDINLIDPNSVEVKDTTTGVWKKMPLVEAIRSGLVDGDSATVKDLTNKKNYSLIEGLELGLLIDNKAAVSVQRAIHQGLYDEETGKFSDPNTGRKITLHEAVRQFIINPLLPCYWNEKTESLMPLSETCRAGIIDRRAGTFKEPDSDSSVPLSKALELGLMVDIETCNFDLYEAIKMGLHDDGSTLFVVPSTGRKLNLKDAIKEELINPKGSFIKNTTDGEYVKLDEAIEPLKIIDDEKCLYVSGDYCMSLKEATRKNLIIPSHRPYAIDEAIKHGLFKSDVGRFIDPETGRAVDLVQGMACNLLSSEFIFVKDPVTQQVKNINKAIDDGIVDVDRGLVVNHKTNAVFPLDKALADGILLSVKHPLTGSPPASFSKTSKEMIPGEKYTLEEFIESEIINPDEAVVKDFKTNQYKSLKQAIIDEDVDLSEKGIYEKTTVENQNMPIVLKSGIKVFLKEPLTFDEALDSKHLSVVTGKFTKPKASQQMSLKDAVQSGIVDSDSAVVKDVAKCKLLNLSEAFEKGLIDSDKANVVDSETSKLYTLAKAINSGLVLTPRVGLPLIESLKYGLYDSNTGTFVDPFSTGNAMNEKKRLTLNEAITSGLIDPSSTMIKDSSDGNVVPLSTAIVNKLVDGDSGQVKDVSNDEYLDFLNAQQKGFVLAAKARVSNVLIIFLFIYYLLVSFPPRPLLFFFF